MDHANDDIPTFEDLAADPEIAPLLDFEPVPRKIERSDGWYPELQRELIARIAATGTAAAATRQMGKYLTGAKALYKTPGADSFRTAWDAAVVIGRRRTRFQPFRTGPIPGVGDWQTRAASPDAHTDCPRCAEAERDDKMRYRREHEQAIRRTRRSLFLARRDYLLSIADDPERRAAWELLCGPADWAAARKLREQPDEDPDRACVRELRGPTLQIPITTGFVPQLTAPDYDPDGDPLAELERSIARNDPRWSNEPSPLQGRGQGEGADE